MNIGANEPIKVPVVDPLQMAWYELSDLGNACRLRDRAGGRLLCVEGRWVAFDGKRWSTEDGQRLANLKAHEVARGISTEAAAIIDEVEGGKLHKSKVAQYEERATQLYRHAVTSGNANKTSAMLAQAQNLLFARRDDFDRDELTLNVNNGTLRFYHSGKGKWAVRIDPHEQADMLSKIADVDYEPLAECPRWTKHMATVLPDAEVRLFFQQCAGYGLTGSIREQCIFLLQGKGGDGKSTCMNVLREIGGGYADKAAVETFMAGAQRSGAEASPDLARLGGDMRLVTTAEPKLGGRLDEGRIKDMTGGEPMNARELHGNPFTYIPRFKVFFQCNRKPRISGDDNGIWRRIIVIPFPHSFTEDDVDKGILPKLLEERSGILNWVIDGILSWLNAGRLVPPQKVKDNIEQYRRASNPFGDWFGDWVDCSDDQISTQSSDLFASYKEYCSDQAVTEREIMSSTAFGRALGDKQLYKYKGAGGKARWRGARLRGIDEVLSNPVENAGDDRSQSPPDPTMLDD